MGISLLYSIYVSGYKNKMGFFHFSTHSSYLEKKDEINTKGVSNDDFFHWFSGFTDAEGNFLITLDREYIKFRFKINLHIDDVKVLYLIKSKLNIVPSRASRATVEFMKRMLKIVVLL